MSEQPTVCAVMLTADRPEMARRAVECFRAQTYPKTFLRILDTGKSRHDAHQYIGREGQRSNERLLWNPSCKETIGELRNLAAAAGNEDIIVHLDDDDWSHPGRIAEQVTLLQSSGADAVGYREMLFWHEDARSYDECHREVDPYGEAWLYSNPDPRYCLGTSLCYWRKTWERVPFQALPKTKGGNAEDNEWLKSVRSVSVSSMIHGMFAADYGPTQGEYMPMPFNAGPRMVARIHSSNTSDYGSVVGKSHNWRRVPEWDAYCESVMR